MTEEKFCNRCRQNFDISKFTKNNTMCKECISTYHSKYTNTFNGFIKTLYKSAKAHAKEKMLKGRKLAGEFTIIENDIFEQWNIQNGLCWYSGIPMIPKPLHNWQSSLERKNPELGYIQSNIVLCVLELNSRINWSYDKIPFFINN